ncbi:MAG: FecR family protein [Rhizobium sp.]|nr:FecR family protein [Rhizobium sp.]
MSVTDHPQQQEVLLEEAMDWLMRLNEAPTDAGVIAGWEDWLQASDAHASAWAKICRTWAALGDMPSALPETVSQPIEIRAASPAQASGWRVSRRGLGLAAATLMSAGLVAILFGPALQLRLAADYRTGAGETAMVTLADGSSVTLAPETALAEDVSGDRRHVRLLSGEAFFEVERDTSRPFVVEAADASVRVLGTAFSVRDSGHGTRVELAHGAIVLTPDTAQAGGELTLVPGDVVTVERADGKMERSQIDPGDIALWRQGRLAVTDQPLGDVVALIQRQHPGWIVMPEERLAALRVTGLYDLSDPDKALMALTAPFGLTVRQVSPYLQIISSR